MAAALESVRLVLMLVGLALVYGGDCPAGTQSNKPESYEWKIMTADVLLQGKVDGKVSSETSSANYSVIFNVSCILKGAPVNAQIRIDQAGYNPQTCLTAELSETNGETGEGYFVYLRKISDTAYVQMLRPDEATPGSIGDIHYLCDASFIKPLGGNEKEHCITEKEDGEDCVPRPVSETPVRDQTEVQPISDPSVQEPDSSKVQDNNNNNKYQGNNSGHMATTSFFSTTLTAVSLIFARLM